MTACGRSERGGAFPAAAGPQRREIITVRLHAATGGRAPGADGAAETARPRLVARPAPVHGAHLRELNVRTYLPTLEVLDIPESGERPVPGYLVSYSCDLTRRAHQKHPCIRLSHRSDILAVGDWSTGTLGLYPLSVLTVRQLITQPMARMTPTDVTAVSAVLANPVLDRATRKTLTSLRICRDYRFGSDIVIGDTAALTAAADDIELGDPGTAE